MVKISPLNDEFLRTYILNPSFFFLDEGLLKAVNKRKRLLSYLKKKKIESYKNVINKLNIRK